MWEDLGSAMHKPPAVISIDVDSLWVIAENIGQSARHDESAIYTQAVPEFLRLLDLFSIKATFFCIGQDLSIDSNKEVVAEIVRRGHEVANHTMNHPKDWTAINSSDILAEIARCHDALATAGVKPVGFRASGYYLDRNLVSALHRMGYVYDSSVLPSYAVSLLMPLGRILMARSTKGNWSYGQLAYALAPLQPYFLDEQDIFHQANIGSLLELPIAVVPLVRLPFHSTFVFAMGLWLFEWGLRAFRRSGLPLVYVFHAVDLLDGDANGRLKNYVTTRVPFRRRLEIVQFILRSITEEYSVVTCSQLANQVKGATNQ